MAAAFSSSQKRYDVFLSFRGEDTRNNFTAHLHQELRIKGINTFFDEDKLERGQVISPALIAAIESSMFYIVVLSEDYASSRWCLEEMVKILECNKSKEERVLPIFYNVDPSDVRNHRGKFGEALAKHEDSLAENKERVKIWRDALTEVANLSGWDSRNKKEPLLIKEIVQKLLKKLLNISASDTEKNLVGIHSRLQELRMLLCLQSNDVRMVGICGMGGIGKTTLARAIYREISNQFEACSFLEIADDFKEGDLTNLQEKYLCQLLEEQDLKIKGSTSIKARLHSRKVLIVLDNVNNVTILEHLAGDQDWFGQGSRIIVTTRDKRLLISHGVECYEVTKLSCVEAFEFLNHHLLKHELPTSDFLELSREIVFYAQGLPLALKVLSSFLFSMSKEEWTNQLDKLKRIPNKTIQEVLKLSYDGLDDNEKNVFLDIACFFKGEDKDYVMEILKGCGFFPCTEIRTLIDKSLISIFDNKLEMHNLIQEMGREIVRQQSLTDPSKRSRLWFHEDIFDVLQRNMGNEKIEGIFLNLSHLEDILDFNTQAFAGMNKLRLLKIYKSDSISTDLGDTFNKKGNCKVRFSRGLKFCFNDLRCLYWHGYSLKSLPNDLNPKNLVDLSMPYSHIKLLWKGIKVLEKLKFMDLSHSKYLIHTPDFSRITKLEHLVLKGCINLCKIHPSIGELNNLNFLSLENCKMLRSLPSSTCNLKSLETFILSGCSKFEEFPENFEKLEMLKKLHADGIGVRVLPPSIFSMRNLKMLSLHGCKGPASASWLWRKRSSNSICFTVPSPSNLCSLVALDLSDCNISDGASLSGLGFFSSLEWLNLSGNNFVTLPNISQLSHLRRLRLENCKRLQALPQLPSSICSLSAKNCTLLRRTELLKLLPTEVHVPLNQSGPVKLHSTYSVLIPGSRIPDWITYQSSGEETEADLPPNWSTNFLGFALALVFVCQSGVTPQNLLSASAQLCFRTGSCYSICYVDLRSVLPMDDMVVGQFDSANNYEGDHVLLSLVPFPPSRSPPQGTRIEALFQFGPIKFVRCGETLFDLGPVEFQGCGAIKRCGLSLMYANKEINCDNVPTIQSNFPSSTPPLKKSILVLEEISAGEPIEYEGYDHDSESEETSASDDSHRCHGSESEDREDLQITPNLPLNRTFAFGLLFFLVAVAGILCFFIWMKEIAL